MLSNICEENQVWLIDSIHNLYMLKLLHDEGVDVTNYGHFTVSHDADYDSIHTIFSQGIEELFDTEVEIMFDYEFEFEIKTPLVTEFFNTVTDSEKVIEKINEEIADSQDEIEIIVTITKDGIKCKAAPVYGYWVVPEILEKLIRVRRLLLNAINEAKGEGLNCLRKSN